MRRLILVSGLALLFSTFVHAQRHGGGSRGGFMGGGARISSGFPRGGGGFGHFGGAVRVSPGYARSSARFGGFRHYPGRWGGFGSVRFRSYPRLYGSLGYWGPGFGFYFGSGYYGRPFYSPYGWYGYPVYAYPPVYAAPPNVTVIYPPPYDDDDRDDDYDRRNEQEVRRAPPQAREDSRRDAAPAARDRIRFDIAMRDGIVYSALAYWVEEDRLNFIDVEGKRHSVPLAEVDRARSEELNRQKQVEFRLPRR